MKMHLGLIIDNTGAVKNHRSILKIFINPILRLICRRMITSEVDGYNVKHLCIIKCDRGFDGFWIFWDLNPGEFVIKKRVLF